MHRRISLLIAAVAVVCLAIAVPTASAATKTDKAQSKALKKQAKSIKKNSSSIKKGSKDVTALKNSAKAVTGAIDTLKVIAARADANGAAFQAAAPSVIKGLTDLQTGLLAAGAGLNSLKTLATSTENGYGQVFAGGTPVPGSFVVTPDIPDNVQQAQVSQQFVGTATGVITLQVGVRSTESDGTGADNPAAFCRTTITSGANSTTSTATSAPNPVQPAPFYPINTKSPPTSTTETSFPFGPIPSDVMTNLTDTTPVTGNAVAPTGTPATAAAGVPYTVTLACVDPSASAADPSA